VAFLALHASLMTGQILVVDADGRCKPSALTCGDGFAAHAPFFPADLMNFRSTHLSGLPKTPRSKIIYIDCRHRKILGCGHTTNILCSNVQVRRIRREIRGCRGMPPLYSPFYCYAAESCLRTLVRQRSWVNAFPSDRSNHGGGAGNRLRAVKTPDPGEEYLADHFPLSRAAGRADAANPG